MPPTVEPKPLSFAMIKVPTFSKVTPLKVFVPDSVRLPTPILVKASKPLPSESTPLKVVDVPSPPTVKTLAPEVLVVIAPPPAIEPTVSEAFTL